MEALSSRDSERYWDQKFIFPLESEISTYFGIKKEGKVYSYYHRGVDFSAPEGMPVKAINNGKVILSEENFNIYGNLLVIDHGQGVISCYFHLSKIFKKEGEIVKKGETIAEVGNTGWSMGSHLHLGIYLQGEAVDPLWWIDFSKELVQ